LLSCQRQAGGCPAHGSKPVSSGCRGPLPLPRPGGGAVAPPAGVRGLRAAVPARAQPGGGVLRREESAPSGPGAGTLMTAVPGVGARHARVVAVLGYHKIGPPAAGGWETWYYVPEATFETQLVRMRGDGWEFIDVVTLLRGL